MNECVSDLIRQLEAGGDPEQLIPMNWSGSRDSFIEICMIYIKYGTDPERIRICRRKIKDAGRTEGRISRA